VAEAEAVGPAEADAVGVAAGATAAFVALSSGVIARAPEVADAGGTTAEEAELVGRAGSVPNASVANADVFSAALTGSSFLAAAGASPGMGFTVGAAAVRFCSVLVASAGGADVAAAGTSASRLASGDTVSAGVSADFAVSNRNAPG
jgi:hypothetical protein